MCMLQRSDFNGEADGHEILLLDSKEETCEFLLNSN